MDQEKLKIALIAGGYSGEYTVSLSSQEGLMKFLSDSPYEIYPVLLRRDHWTVLGLEGDPEIDKGDFSFVHPETGRKVRFDFAYITIHGTPGEDGHLTGYLDMLQIPYSCCPTLIGALTFDKYVCARYLSTFGIKIAPAVRLTKYDRINIDDLLREPGLPCFVKPNNGGSSIATTHVTEREQLQPAIEKALAESGDVMIQSLITGTEITCGAYEDAEGIHILPITEVVPKSEFFDYDAKYNGAVDEITPARIPEETTARVRDLTHRIYRHLRAAGIIRVDYFIESDGTPVLLEVNTTPGMTATSFIPQQIRAAGLAPGKVLEGIIDFLYQRSRR
ncbi:MAG: D-alanine--D-alanine ligase [Porphyromonas sp.]|uniref:D-alanine--D-alanine ligase n=1 Tax=Porphyromonas sp. TaxID=1924944 RepID=UPI002A91254B|nr:D-alanine--D-alanine ligase [Porphyromonas sp.]MDD7468518.1 D-alanine--D-alanine ligase [Bacteroidales bacterium]MDY6101892.1 D-alanine--D-alanine ligase [Porphyromonas sp.]